MSVAFCTVFDKEVVPIQTYKCHDFTFYLLTVALLYDEFKIYISKKNIFFINFYLSWIEQMPWHFNDGTRWQTNWKTKNGNFNSNLFMRWPNPLAQMKSKIVMSCYYVKFETIIKCNKKVHNKLRLESSKVSILIS